MSYIVPLQEASDPKTVLLGGKGANLARMAAAGLPVPRGVVLTADAFRLFLGQTEIGSLFLDSDGDGSEDLLTALERTGWSRKDTFEKLQEVLSTSSIPEALGQEIRAAYEALGGGRVAVRSSATDEDSEDASFAGQYDTFLNVEGADAVLDAVRSCWASLANFRSYIYRKREGLKPKDLSIAVVIQRMVPAEASGVLFTTNPVGSDENHMLIEAAWGLGEGIVSGQVTTDSIIVDKERVAIASKVIRYKLNEYSGSGLTPVPSERREVASLSDEQALELARLALEVVELMGSEQDIEWAVAGGAVQLLQSRPITTGSAVNMTRVIDPDPGETDEAIRAGTMWSMMDAGEATVGIMTPMSQDFMLYYRDFLHPKCLRATGMWHIDNMRPAVGYVFGRCYLNVSHWANSFGQAPPFADPTPLLRRFASEEIDFENYKTPYKPIVKGLGRIWPALYWMLGQWRLVTYRWSQKRSLINRNKTFDEWVDKDLSKLSIQDLYELYKEREKILVTASINYFPFYFLAFGAYEALSDLCRKLKPGSGLEQKLKADISELRTIDVTIDLWELAVKARQVPEVKRVLCQTPPSEVLEALAATEEGRKFTEETLRPLIRKHGVRGMPPEMEYMNSRWVDDPGLLFSMARSFIEHDLEVDQVLSKGDRERDKFTAEAMEGLGFFQRRALKLAIFLYYRFGEARENNRMWAMTETWVFQRIVREIGRRMVEMGILRSMDEMAFIPFRDYIDFIAGKKTADDFPRSLIEKNRQQHLMNLRVPDPPLTFVGPYDPSKRLYNESEVDVIEGIGTSPGQAEGRARLIVDVKQQTEEFQPGEILVTHFTNATWTPLFVTAAAVVVDIGSVLAHSSVVAREYGIPCVANTCVATRAIKTGDWIVVDGDAGKVYIKRNAPENEPETEVATGA